MRAAFTAAVAIAASAVAVSAAYQQAADCADRRRYPPPGRLVDVGGRNLHMMGEGAGGPPVIIVPALADDVTTWVEVMKAAAEAAKTAVHVYDRAGCGLWSDPPAAPVTLDTMAGDLHALIRSAGLGPCVVAGHSIGGIVARRLRARYPADVAGMLFLDSSHEQQVQRFPWRYGSWPRIQRIASRKTRALGFYRLAVDLGLIGGMDVAGYERDVPAWLAPAARAIDLSAQHQRTVVAETLALFSRCEPPPLGQLPVTVITSLNWPGPELRPVWAALQDELAGLSPDTVRVDAGDTGHYVHRDDPDLVVQAIADLVERCR